MLPVKSVTTSILTSQQHTLVIIAFFLFIRLVCSLYSSLSISHSSTVQFFSSFILLLLRIDVAVAVSMFHPNGLYVYMVLVRSVFALAPHQYKHCISQVSKRYAKPPRYTLDERALFNLRRYNNICIYSFQVTMLRWLRSRSLFFRFGWFGFSLLAWCFVLFASV